MSGAPMRRAGMPFHVAVAVSQGSAAALLGASILHPARRGRHCAAFHDGLPGARPVESRRSSSRQGIAGLLNPIDTSIEHMFAQGLERR